MLSCAKTSPEVEQSLKQGGQKGLREGFSVLTLQPDAAKKENDHEEFNISFLKKQNNKKETAFWLSVLVVWTWVSVSPYTSIRCV